MISVKKVINKIIIGAAGVADLGKSSPASVVQRPGVEEGGRAGDTLPPRNPVFTGREDMLAEVGRRLADGPVAVVAVRGLGGMGKSQVALEYAHRMRDSGRYRVAGWVRADSAVMVAEDLAAMAPLVGLAADGPAGEVATSVVTALRSRRDWLVVFDNAQLPGDLAGMLPGGGGHVLITSRNRAWSGVALRLDLEVFSRNESVAFLYKRSGRSEPEAASNLARELGDLPLALAQAAAYIDARPFVTISGYLALYRDPVLARRLRDEGLESGEYPASVARTWLLTFRQLAGDRPAAVELLRLCAFLDPDDIDLDVLAAGATDAGGILAAALGDPLERMETAGTLVGASLVTATAEGRLRVHRLVQAVTRDQLDEDQAAAWSRRALSLVAAAFPGKPDDHRSWSMCASVAPHVEAVTAYTERYPDLAVKRGGLLGQLGIYLAASAQFRTALSVLERALAIKEAAHGPDHPGLAGILTSLGIVQEQLGELPAARATLERALAIKEAAYGPGHLQVAVTLTNLGIVQRELGELPAARATLERALAIEEAAHGPDHPEVAATLASLGIVQQHLGELPAARATLERALTNASPANARALLDASPVSLIFGCWDSSRSARQGRWRSALTGEIVGFCADDRPASKGGARVDPVGMQVQLGEADLTALADRQRSELSAKNYKSTMAAAAKVKGKPVSASMLGLGGIPPSLEALAGVPCQPVIRSHVLSFATLRQIRFGAGPDGDAACRALLAALALNALARSDAELCLRANCDLCERGPAAVEIDQRGGGRLSLEPLCVEAADALLAEALAEAGRAAGVSWAGPALRVTGDPAIVATSHPS